MAQSLILRRGNNEASTKAGQAVHLASTEPETPLGRVKLPYAILALVVSMLFLGAALLHTHVVGANNELSPAQARAHKQSKMGGLLAQSGMNH